MLDWRRGDKRECQWIHEEAGLEKELKPVNSRDKCARLDNVDEERRGQSTALAAGRQIGIRYIFVGKTVGLDTF